MIGRTGSARKGDARQDTDGRHTARLPTGNGTVECAFSQVTKRPRTPPARRSRRAPGRAAAAPFAGSFEDLFEASPDAIVIVRRDGTIVLANKQAVALFGHPLEGLIGRPVEDLVPARFRARHPGNRTGYFQNPHARPMGMGLDLAGLRSDGTEFPAEISLAPMKSGKDTLVMAAVRDMTDRVRAEEARRKTAEEANRLKSEFLANMSHELRTPLNGIIGFADLMASGKVGPVSAEHREYLGDILVSGRHLLQLINDILDVAKIEAGRMEFHPEEVALGRLVGETCDAVRSLAADRKIDLAARVAPDIATVRCDPARLRQILYNFLSNALKFTAEGGRVRVRTAAEGADRFRLEVEDTGIGIKPEDVARLFGEFTQLDAGPARRQQGTGLGLALTKRLVEAQGGRVTVTSTPGRGSVFAAILPRSPEPRRAR